MKTKQNVPLLLTFSYLLFLGLHCIPVLAGSPRFWGMDQWYYFSKTAAFSFLIIGLVPVFQFSRAALIQGASRISSAEIVKRTGSYPFIKYPLFLFAAAALLWRFRQSTHFLGDGGLWASRMRSDTLFSYMRPLSSSIYQVAYAVINPLWRPAAESPYAAAAIVSIVSGLIFLVFLKKTVCALSTDSAERMFLLLAILSAGTTTLFFGYIEAYPPVAAGVMAFIYFGIRYVQGRERAYFLIIIFLVDISLHLTLIALLPSLIVTLLTQGETARIRKRIVPAFSVVIVSVLAALWIVQKHTLFSGFFNENFLPLTERAQSSRAAYSMISPKHLFDCANELLLICPIVLLGAASLFHSAREKDKGSANIVFFLQSIALFYGIEYFLFNKLLGAARDWDIFSSVAIPLSLCTALLLLERFRNMRKELTVLAFAVLALHTGPWVGINASKEKSFNRFVNLVDTGYWSTYAKAYGYELLAKHSWNNNNPSQALHFFNAALKTDPKNKRYRYDLAIGYLHARQYPEALKLYREIYNEDPGSLEVLTALAMLYRYNGQSDLSEKMSLEAIEVDSTSFMAYENLISLYLQTNRTDRGLAALEKCVKIAPDVPRLYRNVSALFAQIGDNDRAKLYSDKALELENQENR